MDALALLCNLHANGPTTMRRLGHAGITRLEQIPGVAVQELAELLNGPPSHALRFIAEAEHLVWRGAGGIPEPDEPLEETEAWAAAPATELTNPREIAAVSPGTTEVRTPISARASTSISARASTPISARASTPISARASTPISARASAPASAPASTLVSAATTTPAEENILQPGLLEGLDDVLCRKLVGQGVRTLRALHDTAGLSLARRIDLPLTQLLDLQYNAQRALRGALRATLHPPVTTAPRIPSPPRTATERAIEQPRSPTLAKNEPACDSPSVSGPFV